MKRSRTFGQKLVLVFLGLPLALIALSALLGWIYNPTTDAYAIGAGAFYAMPDALIIFFVAFAAWFWYTRIRKD